MEGPVLSGFDQYASELYDMLPRNYTSRTQKYVDQALEVYLADRANQHEIDMWNLQNQYNTPLAQMERYKQAGLNPMLMYQQGSPGNATSAPGVHQANVVKRAALTPLQEALGYISQIMQGVNMVANIASDFSGIQKNYAQIANINQQTALNHQNFISAVRDNQGFTDLFGHIIPQNLYDEFKSTGYNTLYGEPFGNESEYFEIAPGYFIKTVYSLNPASQKYIKAFQDNAYMRDVYKEWLNQESSQSSIMNSQAGIQQRQFDMNTALPVWLEKLMEIMFGSAKAFSPFLRRR